MKKSLNVLSKIVSAFSCTSIHFGYNASWFEIKNNRLQRLFWSYFEFAWNAKKVTIAIFYVLLLLIRKYFRNFRIGKSRLDIPLFDKFTDLGTSSHNETKLSLKQLRDKDVTKTDVIRYLHWKANVYSSIPTIIEYKEIVFSFHVSWWPSCLCKCKTLQTKINFNLHKKKLYRIAPQNRWPSQNLFRLKRPSFLT